MIWGDTWLPSRREAIEITMLAWRAGTWNRQLPMRRWHLKPLVAHEALALETANSAWRVGPAALACRVRQILHLSPSAAVRDEISGSNSFIGTSLVMLWFTDSQSQSPPTPHKTHIPFPHIGFISSFPLYPGVTSTWLLVRWICWLSPPRPPTIPRGSCERTMCPFSLGSQASHGPAPAKGGRAKAPADYVYLESVFVNVWLSTNTKMWKTQYCLFISTFYYRWELLIEKIKHEFDDRFLIQGFRIS